MRRLVLVTVVVAAACALLTATVSAQPHGQNRGPRTAVAVYILGDAAGEGQVRGLAFVVQTGRQVRWWLTGSGLPAGAHAQHIHGPGNCEANAPIIVSLPDVDVAADGSFFESGSFRTNRKIAASRALNYWNIHEFSSEGGVGAGVMCGERERVRPGGS